MKTVLCLCAAFALAGAVEAKGGSRSHGSHGGGSHGSGGSHAVHGHHKKNGTYVAPHHATNPNGTRRDNWSSKGNVNPHTGKEGTKDPDARSRNGSS